MKFFRLVRQGVDVGPLMAEVDAAPGRWLADTRRQERLKNQRETQSIILRKVSQPVPAGMKPWDVHASSRTPMADNFPVVMTWVEDFTREIGGELGRVSLARLEPHGRVHPHIDYGEYYRVRDRYHLALRSPGGSEMVVAEEKVVMREGETWWFDNKKRHRAHNPSDRERIHLIFDVLPVGVSLEAPAEAKKRWWESWWRSHTSRRP